MRFWLFAGLALVPQAAWAGPPPKKAAPPVPNAVLPMGRSVGSPTDGKLVTGAHLSETSYLRVVPAYAGNDVRWGLGSLVGMLDRAARAVRRSFPDATLSVGHLSRAGGGDLDRHASHESGRDVDVAFFVKDARGKPLYADHFVSFMGDGVARTWPGATFDDARNWALVAALLSDPVAHVSHIFISTPLRARLLAYAARANASPALQTRAAVTMAQPIGSLPHDDHFHVRISCPPNMSGCVENPTIAKRFTRKKPAAVTQVSAKPKAPPPQQKQPQKPPATSAVEDHDNDGAPGEDSVPAITVAPLDGT